MTTLVIDTETNGREPPEVIELAYGVPFEGRLENIVEERFKPVQGSTNGALATHHILDYELEECRSSGEAKLPAGVQYIIGHNVDYDWEALGRPAVKRICTLAIARKLYQTVDSHALGAMLYTLSNGDFARARLATAHTAVTDIWICNFILVQMIQQLTPAYPPVLLEDSNALWEFSEWCRVPDFISFGKHKGLRISALPRDYKQWILRQPDMDEYLKKAVRETL
jgi:exodeoxyribonuclease X